MRTNKNIRETVRVLNVETQDLHNEESISKPMRDARLEVLHDLLVMLALNEDK